MGGVRFLSKGREMKPNSCRIYLASVLLASVVFSGGTAFGGTSLSPTTGLAIWDTGRTSTGALGQADFAKVDSWTKVAKEEKSATFRGDAVFTNGRIAAVMRKSGATVDVYAVWPTAVEPRAKLQLVDKEGNPAKKLDAVTILDNDRGAVRLEAKYQSSKGSELTAKFRIKRGEVMLEAEPGTGAHRLRVDCPSRFVVLPDFFADDILIDPRQITPEVVQLPSENFLLHMTGKGNSLAMCVFENRDQEVQVKLTGKGQERVITESEVTFGEGKKIWLALMDSPGIWHEDEVRRGDASRIQKLDWKMPFVAQWRVDFTRSNKLTDSWEMLLPDTKSDGFIKPSWMGQPPEHIGPTRRRWTTVLDHFPYPCWVDKAGRGNLQGIRHKALTFAGPTVLYPINRVEETPAEAYTVVDILRNCLGVGPCEYILAVESQKEDEKGRATCSARSALEKIYRSNQQQQRQQEIESALNDALAFVTHIRSRITHYVEFGREIRSYLGEQRVAHPELKEFIDEIDEIAAELEMKLAARKDDIKTPEHVAEMNEEFRKTMLNAQGRGTLGKLKKYTDELTDIGGNQDELVGECRWIVRSMRQRAGLLMATDPKCAELAMEIRERTQKVLLNPASYESARH